MNTDKTLHEITDSTADANAPRTVDGPPVLPAKPVTAGPALNPAGSAINRDGSAPAVTLADVKDQAQGATGQAFPTITARADNWGDALTPEQQRDTAIHTSGYRIRELAHAWEALKGSQARNDVEAILVAECAHVRKLQGERDGDGSSKTESAWARDVSGPSKADAKEQRIARNGNRKR